MLFLLDIWESRVDIEREIVQFFQELYSVDNKSRPRMDRVSFHQLSQSKVSSFKNSFTKDEIRQAVFGLDGDRSPGPDGFPIVFFQHFSDLLEDDLLVFFNEFHDNGVIVGELGAFFIALVPKKNGVVSIKDFRPISLIGSLY